MLQNLKVSKKLFVGFAIILILGLIGNIAGIYGLISIGNAAKTMYIQEAKPLGNLVKSVEDFQRLRLQARIAIFNTGNSEELKSIESEIDRLLLDFETEMGIYSLSIETDEDRMKYNETMNTYAGSFKSSMLEVLDGARKGLEMEELLTLMSVNVADTISEDLSTLVDMKMEVMEEANDYNMSMMRLLCIAIIAFISIAVIVSISFAVRISSLISVPLNTMTDYMKKVGTTGELSLSQEDVALIEQMSKIKDEIGLCVSSTAKFVGRILEIAKTLDIIASGDLTVELKLLSEEDNLGLSLQRMIDNLNKMFNEINESAAQVATGSRQIADGAQALAQGSTEQAAAIEQLSASITEIADMITRNAEKIYTATELAREIRANAELGTSKMKSMMEAVDAINQCSREIANASKTIDNIAFQTNILALNAAVEAARAGQHGKGFAVVAEEVRNLASNSGLAAKDITSLTSDSLEKANTGVKSVSEAAESLTKIADGIVESSQIMEGISQSSKEQSVSISQIKQGISQVAEVVQENSATAQESASASEEISNQADNLKRLTDQFELK